MSPTVPARDRDVFPGALQTHAAAGRERGCGRPSGDVVDVVAMGESYGSTHRSSAPDLHFYLAEPTPVT
jgi:hypothetical protein